MRQRSIEAVADMPITAAELVRIEADALLSLADRLDGVGAAAFSRAVALVVTAVQGQHRVATTGVGKSGIIARKLAATLVSLGTPAQFLHAADAVHGDLGILGAGDIVIALSYSGETAELLNLLPVLPKLNVSLISLVGCASSTLAAASTVALDCSVDREACAHDLAPTASTTAMLALGDALAQTVAQTLDFKPRRFAELHPGGQLGRRLQPVRALMHSGDAVPRVAPTAGMPEIIHEMSAKRLGITAVSDEHGRIVGVISDGDLRRLLERNGPHAFHKRAADILHAGALTIAPTALAVEALVMMEQRKVTALLVTEDGTPAAPLVGVVHLHDLWQVAPASDSATN